MSGSPPGRSPTLAGDIMVKWFLVFLAATPTPQAPQPLRENGPYNDRRACVAEAHEVEAAIGKNLTWTCVQRDVAP